MGLTDEQRDKTHTASVAVTGVQVGQLPPPKF